MTKSYDSGISVRFTHEDIPVFAFSGIRHSECVPVIQEIISEVKRTTATTVLINVRTIAELLGVESTGKGYDIIEHTMHCLNKLELRVFSEWNQGKLSYVQKGWMNVFQSITKFSTYRFAVRITDAFKKAVLSNRVYFDLDITKNREVKERDEEESGTDGEQQ